MEIQGLENYSDEDAVIADNGTGVELEDTSVDERIIEPFDPSLIRVDTKPMTIDLLRLRIEYSELELAPDFQRKADIWKDEAQSRLIESMLIRIPLPAFYMDATNEEKWLVVDGLQRLTTLKKFMVDKTLKLHGLEFLKQFDGKGAPRLPINKPLFESWSVNFNQLSDEQVGRLTLRREILRERFIDLMNSPERKFNEAISLATGDPKKVRLRFEAIEQLIKDVLS